jgi:ATP/maltotriose-dependent transcriptional regulator MalT
LAIFVVATMTVGNQSTYPYGLAAGFGIMIALGSIAAISDIWRTGLLFAQLRARRLFPLRGMRFLDRLSGDLPVALKSSATDTFAVSATEPLLPRARLTALLDQIPRHRLTVVTAGPGGGKTSAVRGWTRARPDHPVAWLTWTDDATLIEEICQALGAPVGWIRSAGLATELAATVSRPTILVIDEVERIKPGTSGARLLEEFCHHGGDDLHLVLISRSAVPFPIQRLRGLGHVFQVSAEQLAFTPAETRSLSSIVLGSDDLAEEVHELTKGWPVAVRLTLSWLSGLPLAERAKGIAATPLFDYLVEEVVKDEHEEFLRVTARLPWFTDELCQAMGVGISREELRALAAQHILITPCDQGFVVSTLVREFMGDVARVPVAAHWYEAHGFVREALALPYRRSRGRVPWIWPRGRRARFRATGPARWSAFAMSMPLTPRRLGGWG